jgi:heme/copper-type cytochrome/quinol oxidase subunit 1
MYMVGLSHTTRMLFSTLTVMISVPAATKLMHWCVTIVNSNFVMEIPLLFSLTFTFFLFLEEFREWLLLTQVWTCYFMTRFML